jgi:hypothetical protein
MGMSWFDIVLLAGVAALVALGAKRKMTGLIIGFGSLILFRVLISFAERGTRGIVVALVMAVLAGVLFGMLGRASVTKARGLDLAFSIAGGFGGLLTGLVLVGALITSLPLQQRFDNTIDYPTNETGSLLASGVNSSQLVKGVGRNIVLYSLLADKSIPASQRGVYAALHNYFIVREPWETSN